jgi:hypothetical protein
MAERHLLVDIQKHGVLWVAKKYGYAKSTLYRRWKPRKEELKKKEIGAEGKALEEK